MWVASGSLRKIASGSYLYDHNDVGC
jgi:hypothetical protein